MPDSVRAFIGVGSNIEPYQNVRQALRLLARRERLVAVSTVYRTSPLAGRVDTPAEPRGQEQPDYLNCVVEIATVRRPLELKRLLRKIEQQLCRGRGPDRYAARTIDLDLVAYGHEQVRDEGLTVPDPEIAQRAFVALPLGELAPDLPLPGLGPSAAAVAVGLCAAMRRAPPLPVETCLAASCQEMEALPDFTELLREDLQDGQREG